MLIVLTNKQMRALQDGQRLVLDTSGGQIELESGERGARIRAKIAALTSELRALGSSKAARVSDCIGVPGEITFKPLQPLSSERHKQVLRLLDAHSWKELKDDIAVGDQVTLLGHIVTQSFCASLRKNYGMRFKRCGGVGDVFVLTRVK